MNYQTKINGIYSKSFSHVIQMPYLRNYIHFPNIIDNDQYFGSLEQSKNAEQILYLNIMKYLKYEKLIKVGNAGCKTSKGIGKSFCQKYNFYVGPPIIMKKFGL